MPTEDLVSNSNKFINQLLRYIQQVSLVTDMFMFKNDIYKAHNREPIFFVNHENESLLGPTLHRHHISLKM